MPATPTSLQDAIPGLGDMTNSASSNILQLLNGNPSPSLTRTTNAYWGVGAGQPATGDITSFIGNRGTDLYHTQANANQQQGLGDLLNLVGGYSGTVAPTPGQNQQNSQFYANLGQQGTQFNQQQALAEFQAQVQAMLGFGNLGLNAASIGQGGNPFASYA